MNKYKIIAIIGKAGSGKDTILKKVLSKNKNIHEIVSYTTRPPREGEVDGINYHFISNDKFADLVLSGEMVEACEFNGWFYGTGIGSLEKKAINIGVFNPTGIDAMAANKDIELYVFYLNVNDKIRLIRQLERESNPDIDEIFRRYKTDREDFYDLDFHYNELDNEDKNDMTYALSVINAAINRLQNKNG